MRRVASFRDNHPRLTPDWEQSGFCINLYESNWLAIYEYALAEEDERLKTIELARVEEVLREEVKETESCYNAVPGCGYVYRSLPHRAT
jgi:hypothetical protein